MADKEGKKVKEKADEVITAVYKVNLHCGQCAHEIKKPLLTTQGVQTVDVDIEKSEIKVKGVIEVIKIQKIIEKFSKKKVELVSPQIKEKAAAPEQKKVKEAKNLIVRTTSVKVHMHCDKCEHDLRNKLLKHKGIYSVKTDMKAQSLTVQGPMESDKLLSYLRRKVHKHAEIINSKPDKKEKENADKKETEKGEAKSTKSAEITEFKEEIKVVEVKTKETSAPYFVHYVYAPQLFSDENPNACSVL